MNLVMTTFQVLLAEVAGVMVFTGVLYIYWNLMTKNN